ncbi:MAG: mycothiol conjugate amidase Mca [Acidimicrobiia bacterium]|nr:mycothiol conjugate amidase Mca [Acidimicrobiia bacterium]
MTSSALRLLSVHAHPDDEASKGAGTVARYTAEGAEATLVCCTGGEAGEVLNPAMDRPEVLERLHEVRLEELERSVAIIGYTELVMLGYRDSGMPDTPENADPNAFANAPLDQAVERLVGIIRRTKPQVVITYGEDQQGYPHPDHLRVHDISIVAWDAAGDPERFPEAGEPWTPSKLYYSAWARARFVAMHEGFLSAGIESPFDQKWFDRPSHDHLITTQVDVRNFYAARSGALKAHATQIDPTSPFWFGLPDDVVANLYPWEDFQLANSRVPTDVPETDLFAGLR